ncbi:MAG: hypothetical protein CM15mP103_02550 [Gammaproteobacteria bacterium]|nr:MAG: hypothetical protein CM15mP103_02550 [Gammaproteobacteria bacterium]
MKLTVSAKRWIWSALCHGGETINHIDVLHVMLEHKGFRGTLKPWASIILARLWRASKLSSWRLIPAAIARLDREALQTLLPPGGSRNGLDCALWDLEAKQTAGESPHSQVSRWRRCTRCSPFPR